MAKSKKKPKKPKPRIKVAPPSKRHKSVKDYDRKKSKKLTVESMEDGFDKTSNLINSGARTLEDSAMATITIPKMDNVEKVTLYSASNLTKIGEFEIEPEIEPERGPIKWVRDMLLSLISDFKK